MIFSIYKILSVTLKPLLCILLSIRLKKGKEIKGRVCERFGISTAKRPNSKIIWIHAASNGEMLSSLPLIEYFSALRSRPHILLTTMTVTSAKLAATRTDAENVTHQFIPYDQKDWIKKFHSFWKPDLVIWIESELWPNHLDIIKQKNIPAVLLNARISDKSKKRWSLFQSLLHSMLSSFDIILTQTPRDKNNFEQLGITNVDYLCNLKDFSNALPFDPHAADDIRDIIATRPTILFASTHDPEEQMALRIHQRLKNDFPDLLSIIVPRHPQRGEAIVQSLNQSGFNIAQRSLKMSPRIATDIYIADTLGELGLFYHLCPIVYIGNSLNTKPGGGHNLLEPAWHDCAIISGDSLYNFSTQAAEMPTAGACMIIQNENELYEVFKKLLSDKDFQQRLANNAYRYVEQKQTKQLDSLFEILKPSCQKAKLL